MPFLYHVLQPPSYGWETQCKELIRPSVGNILKDFFSRLNIFRDRKNWLPFFSWFKILCLAWQYIRLMQRLRAVSSYRDYKSAFVSKYTT